MSKPARIHAEEVHRRMDAGDDALIIDVRSAEEYRTLHAAGAVLLPLEEVNTESVTACARQSGHNERTPIYFICHSGRRATTACERILGEFPHSAVIEGGTLAWAQEGYPVHEGDKP